MNKLTFYLFGAVLLLLLAGQVGGLQARPGPANGAVLAAAGAVAPAGQPTPAAPAAGVGPSTMRMPDGYPAQVPAFKSDTDIRSTTQVTGSPAIQPTLKGTAPQTPAFTAMDVIGYQQTHNPNAVGNYTSATTIGVVKIEFLTERALRTRIPGARAIDPDTLLCYVQYSGDFLLNSPSSGALPTHYQRAAEVFDAHSGNLLMEGVGPWIK